MKAAITFYIGLIVTVISVVQFVLSFSWYRLIGLAVGVFFMLFGWLIGWAKYRRLTVLLGHIAVTIGCLVTAYAVYQIPSMKASPSWLQVLDTPLFWGLFTIWGGNCMITHGYCNCTISMNRINSKKTEIIHK